MAAKAGATFRTTWVQDFTELSRDLKKIEPGLQKEFRNDLRPLGVEVANEVKSSMPSITGTARSSVRSGVTNKGAYVKEGKATAPYVGWLDFGGVLKPTGLRRNTITRTRVKSGRYLYPAIERKRQEINRVAVAAVQKAARKAGWRD